jgi:hypothetical protein
LHGDAKPRSCATVIRSIVREGRAYYPGDTLTVPFDEAASLIEVGRAVPDGFVQDLPRLSRRGRLALDFWRP